MLSGAWFPNPKNEGHNMRDVVERNVLRTLSVLAAIAVVLTVMVNPVLAQVPSSSPPYNTDLGALITNTARASATVNTADQQNSQWVGVECTYNRSAASGSPSTTIAIQFKDSASASYQTLAISGAITATATPTTVVVSPGIQTSSLPSAMVALQMHLPRIWRVQQVTTGSNTTDTGTVGCNMLK
jgi:hypothetical protein